MTSSFFGHELFGNIGLQSFSSHAYDDTQKSRSQLKTQQQQQQQHLVEPDITTRTHEITEIAKSIASLAELFKDLSTLVIDQGTILDSVEYNIEQTTVHVQEAAKQLHIATRFVSADARIGGLESVSLTLGSLAGLFTSQISKEHRAPEMYLPPRPHHYRLDPCPDFQTSTTGGLDISITT